MFKSPGAIIKAVKDRGQSKSQFYIQYYTLNFKIELHYTRYSLQKEMDNMKLIIKAYESNKQYLRP